MDEFQILCFQFTAKTFSATIVNGRVCETVMLVVISSAFTLGIQQKAGKRRKKCKESERKSEKERL